MNLILFLPFLIALVLLIRGRTETAFLSVYLPTLLLVPDDYTVRLPHLPPLSAAQLALVPIGLAGLFRLIRSRRFAWMDLLVLAYVVSVAISEVMKERILNDGIFFAAGSFVSIFFGYIAGREMIEPGLRLAAARRIVILLLWNFPSGLFEWRLGMNPYGILGRNVLFLSQIDTGAAIRNGHGKFGGAFTYSEITGIALGMTIALNAWLVYLNRGPGRTRLGERLAKLEKYHLPAIVLLVALVLTQERGPLMAVAAAYMILQIPRFKNVKLATVGVAAILGVGALAAYVWYQNYTNVDPNSQMSEQQHSAYYRRVMNELYVPIADEGGWFGYGAFGVPSIGGIRSLDNEYLRVHLVQGKLGYYLLLLIAAESMRVLAIRLWNYRGAEDRAFVISMIAAVAVLWITLYTVYMGQQLPQFAFLFLGWCQSIVPTSAAVAVAAEAAERPKFAFQRVVQ